jgi:hypothetical protein
LGYDRPKGKKNCVMRMTVVPGAHEKTRRFQRVRQSG